jgi:hypothetical protein
MKHLTRGSAVTIWFTTKTKSTYAGAWSYADPDNGCKITIVRESDNSTIIDDVAMTKSATGIYYYYWQTTTSYGIGRYVVQCTADGTTYDGIFKETLAYVEG